MASLMSEASFETFSGSPLELDRFLSVQRSLIGADTDVDATANTQALRLAAALRGPALDWYIATAPHQPGIVSDIANLERALRDMFGLSNGQRQAGFRLQFGESRQGATDLLEYLAHISALATVSGCGNDPTLLAVVPGKLAPRYQLALANSGRLWASWNDMRTFLANVYAQDPQSALALAEPRKTSRKPKCGKCGKRGHTAEVCRTKN